MIGRCWGLAICVLLLMGAHAQGDEISSATLASGMVLSNGQVIEGKVSSTPGRPIRFFSAEGALAGKYTVEQMAKVEFHSVNRKMEQLWRFPEFGSDEKEKDGEPFPLHDLEAVLTLRTGEIVKGKMATAVFYIEGADKNHKFVIESKQRGEPGQKFEDMLYVKTIVIGSPETTTPDRIGLVFETDKPGAGASVHLLTRRTLKTLTPRRAGKDLYEAPWDQEEGLYVAVEEGGVVKVGWPENHGGVEPEVIETAKTATRELANFFTVRDVLAIAPDPFEPQTHLVMLVALYREKEGSHTGDPWRLSIWRWRRTPRGQIFGPPEEGMFLRIANKKQQPPPKVEIVPAYWRQERRDGVLRIGMSEK